MAVRRASLAPEIWRSLKDAGVLPRRRLSQNFLANPAVYDRILTSAELSADDTVVEIGAGLGFLTQAAARMAHRVIAFELDSRLAAFLVRKFAATPSIQIVHRDFLRSDLSEVGKDLKVIGNIPYHITSPIVEHLIELQQVRLAILMVQKEVARRIVSGPGSSDYGRLSLFVQYTFQPEIVLDVPPEDFLPAPKVTSSVIRFIRRSRPPVRIPDETLFFQLIKASFAHRRKTLSNNLKSWISPALLPHLFAKSSLSPTLRAEQLGLEEFARLCIALHELRQD